jgi:hypothetical protein
MSHLKRENREWLLENSLIRVVFTDHDNYLLAYVKLMGIFTSKICLLQEILVEAGTLTKKWKLVNHF